MVFQSPRRNRPLSLDLCLPDEVLYKEVLVILLNLIAMSFVVCEFCRTSFSKVNMKSRFSTIRIFMIVRRPSVHLGRLLSTNVIILPTQSIGTIRNSVN